jgi:SAM-dependent methyltransferase
MASIKDTWLEWYKDRKIEDEVTMLARKLIDARVRRILDFGTGTGRHTVYLARMGFDVYGFDWSENAISLARQELSGQGLSATLRVWDMNRTPLPYNDAFFDAVIAVRVLHHTYVEKIRRIASEIARITRVGGYLYIEAPTYRKAIRQKQDGMKSEEPEPGTFLPLEGEEVGVPHHHFTRDEMLRVFANFNPLTLEEKDEHYRFIGIKK